MPGSTPTLPPSGPPPLPRRTHTLAVVSLALGIPGIFLQLVGIIFFPFAILAFFLTVACLICGHLSLGEIKRKSERFTGKSMAVTGLCLGYSAIFVFVAYVILAAVIFGTIFGEFKKTQFKTPRSGKAKMSTPAKHRSPPTPDKDSPQEEGN